MFARVVVLVAAVERSLALRIGIAMAAFGIPSLAICWLLWRRQRSAQKASVSAGSNPFELGAAIRFGLLFGVITFAAKAAQVYLGDAGLYLAGAIAVPPTSTRSRCRWRSSRRATPRWRIPPRARS